MKTRIETDCIGSREIPAEAPWGIHTTRALENFPFPGRRVHPLLAQSYIEVKKACACANGELGYLSWEKAAAIQNACDRLIEQLFDPVQQRALLPLPALQGGAGTSTNMLINELVGHLANAHPIEQVNLHQSTNDTYPTALKLAAIRRLRTLSGSLAQLQGTFQQKEKEFADIVVSGMTERMDAVPMTLGSQFGSFAEAVARDRWRTFKSEERLRTVNLGGTAIGTGLAAPKRYIFLAIEKLRDVTGVNLSRAENLVEATANNDCFVEVSGILHASAVNLIKVCDDLRTRHMLGEIRMPAWQAGSSIMPGKINPVAVEAAIQIGIRVGANHQSIADCVSRGSLQICEFLPLVADSLLESLDLLDAGVSMLHRCVAGIDADQGRCVERVYASREMITAFVPLLGYDRCCELLRQHGDAPQGTLIERLEKEVGRETVATVLSPSNLTALGYRD